MVNIDDTSARIMYLLLIDAPHLRLIRKALRRIEDVWGYFYTLFKDLFVYIRIRFIVIVDGDVLFYDGSVERTQTNC